MAGERVTAPPELVAFAFVEEDYVANRGDVSIGLMRLFTPILAESPNKIFEPKEFAEKVEQRFDIPMSPLAAEGLVEKMAQAGLLFRETEDSQVYRITPQPDFRKHIQSDDVDQLVSDYLAFAEESLGKRGVNISAEEILEYFFKQIVTLDFLSFLASPDKDLFRGETLSLNGGEQEDDRIEVEHLLQVTCAEFVLQLLDTQQDRFKVLEKIVSGVLISDVVLTLKEPAGLKDFANVDIAIDGPLILDLLKLSSSERQDYAEDLVALIDRTGARKITFLHVFDEIRGAINGPLDALRNGRDPYGPLGSRFRMEKDMVAYAQLVLDDLEQKVIELGIIVIDAEEYETEGLDQYCPEDLFDSIRNNVGPLESEVERRIRDARSIAAILRMRAPAWHWPTLADAGNVFVTRNISVAVGSKRALRGRKRIEELDFPPAISDRQLAGLLWLVCGGDIGELSKKRLVANCASVLAPRRDVLSKMRQVLTETDPEKAKAFGALMADKRAQRCLVHSTLGLPAAITAESVEQILEEIKRSTVEEIRLEADQKLGELQEKSDARLEGAKSRYENELAKNSAQIESLEGTAGQLQGVLTSKTEELINLKKARIADVNHRIQRAVQKASSAENRAKWSIILLFIVLVALSAYLSDNQQLLQRVGLNEAVAGYVNVSATVVLSLLSFWFIPHLVFGGVLEGVWHKKLMRISSELGVSNELKDCNIDVNSRSVSEYDSMTSSQ